MPKQNRSYTSIPINTAALWREAGISLPFHKRSWDRALPILTHQELVSIRTVIESYLDQVDKRIMEETLQEA